MGSARCVIRVTTATRSSQRRAKSSRNPGAFPLAWFVLLRVGMTRSPNPHGPSKPAANPPSVTPGTTAVKNAHAASNPPRPAPVEPHWEAVIDSATD
jgi:hypothetical protein